ncbi:hypothetical protein SLEP1_g20944 [Rubroshorea leprosula]|uniref:Uncharacterized protein n=1 Tax=Rubroshorea leprosula TaxID=152421 RepID=A0AAV5J4B8_9ROSI|nr:hypothetical protein SLEP1_g20944 [Rubroshorea leprosula]
MFEAKYFPCGVDLYFVDYFAMVGLWDLFNEMICHNPGCCVIKQLAPPIFFFNLSLIIREENLSPLLCWHSLWQDGKSKLIIKVGSDYANCASDVIQSLVLPFFLVYPFLRAGSGPRP